jgi:hypothetical protein
LGIS